MKTWKRESFYNNSYYLKIIFNLGNKTMSGSIFVSEDNKMASFTFKSLGIQNKKIEFANDDEMKAEAEKYLVKRLNERINELNQVKEMMEN